ncbi:hypothetical protein HaLaN_05055, partial [Haematococcus lacustris]
MGPAMGSCRSSRPDVEPEQRAGEAAQLDLSSREHHGVATAFLCLQEEFKDRGIVVHPPHGGLWTGDLVVSVLLVWVGSVSGDLLSRQVMYVITQAHHLVHFQAVSCSQYAAWLSQLCACDTVCAAVLSSLAQGIRSGNGPHRTMVVDLPAATPMFPHTTLAPCKLEFSVIKRPSSSLAWQLPADLQDSRSSSCAGSAQLIRLQHVQLCSPEAALTVELYQASSSASDSVRLQAPAPHTPHLSLPGPPTSYDTPTYQLLVPAAQEQQQQQPLRAAVVEPVSSQEHALASQASTGGSSSRSSSSKRSNISKRSTMSIRFNKLMAAAVQRAHLLMSETPSLLTLISESGLVLVQNEASVSYYGNLEGSSVAALGIRLQAGSSPCLKPCPVEGLLRLLLKFAPPGLLEELLQTVVVDGQEWKGMLRVAPSLAYLEKIVFSNLGMTSSRPPRPDVEALVVSAASEGSRGDNTVSQEAQVAQQATQVSVAGSSLCQAPAVNAQWQPSVVAVISTQPQPLSLPPQPGCAAGSFDTSTPRPHPLANPMRLAAPRARRLPHACSSSRSVVAQDNQLHGERSNPPLPHAELGHITALGFAAQLGSELTLRSARSTVPAFLDAAGGSTRRKRVTRCTTAHAAASFMSHAPAGGRSAAPKHLHPRDPTPQASQLPAAASQLICAPARSSSTPSTQLLTNGLVVALPEGTHDTQIDVGQGRPLPALQSAASGEQPQCKLSSEQMEEPLPSSPKRGSSPSLVVQAGYSSGAQLPSSPNHPARVTLADAMQLIVEEDRGSAGTGHDQQGSEAVPGLVRTSMSTQLLAEALHLAKASAADEQPFYMTSQEQGTSCGSPRATASWSAFSPNPQPQPGPIPTISGLGLAPVHLVDPALQRHGSSSTPISPSASNLRRSLDSQSWTARGAVQHPSPTT